MSCCAFHTGGHLYAVTYPEGPRDPAVPERVAHHMEEERKEMCLCQWAHPIGRGNFHPNLHFFQKRELAGAVPCTISPSFSAFKK